MPTLKVTVAMTVPTMQWISRVWRLTSCVRTSAMSVDRRVSRFDLGPYLARAGPELVGGDVVALQAVVERLRDDLGVVAGNAAGGELRGDGERVEHRGQPTTRPAEAKPAPPPGGFRPDFGAFTGTENE